MIVQQLIDLPLHEYVYVAELNCTIIRVPNGFIYRFIDGVYQEFVFVPEVVV